VSLTPERPLPLKGVRWPIRAFRMREAVTFDDHTERLYGREDEQAMLDQCLADFEQRRGTVLLVVGEAGLGKTALVDYLRQTAAQRGITCLSGGAGSVEIANLAPQSDNRALGPGATPSSLPCSPTCSSEHGCEWVQERLSSGLEAVNER
jgi:AAA ATPase domain